MSTTAPAYVRFSADKLDPQQAHRDLVFSGIRARLNGDLMVPEAQAESARKILYESQDYEEE